MEREQQETKQTRAIAKSEEDDSQVAPAEPGHEESGTPGAFQAFRTLLEQDGVRNPSLVAVNLAAIRASRCSCLPE
jgi:hypothetical protein